MPAPLLDLILDRIASAGPMTVAEFVDLALYEPSRGYYAREPQRSGRRGDFFTSVDLGPMFGRLLAVQFVEMWQAWRAVTGARADAPFDLLEAAAGNGRLARDVMDHAAAHAPAFYDAVRLHLVDRSPRAREQQAEVLGPHASRLAGSVADLPETIDGIVYANELLDALPPHLVVARGGRLREVLVDRAPGGGLRTVEGDPSSPRLAEYLADVGAVLEDGWHAEVNLAARDWVAAAGSRLSRGFLLLIDYGHEATQLYSAARAAGTLTTFRRHVAETREEGPGWLLEPGERDITSHVDLTAVRLAARQAGLAALGVVDQTYFLLGLGRGDHLFEDAGAPALGDRLALKTLLLPGGIGSTHKVMVFAKEMGTPPLAGLSFGRRLT